MMIDGVSGLYHLKVSQPDKAMREACREFESIFAHQLLKTMGSSIKEDEGLAGGMYRDMLYMTMARSATEGDGLGIAKVIYDQMKNQGVE